LGILLGRHFVHFAGHLTQTHILRPSHQGILGIWCASQHLVCVAPGHFWAFGVRRTRAFFWAFGVPRWAFGVRRTRAFFWAFGVPRWAFGVRRTRAFCWAFGASHKGILGNLVRRRLFGHLGILHLCFLLRHFGHFCFLHS
jgi:hypothetical protein